jgi:serine/threonine-protein kinase RsbW
MARPLTLTKPALPDNLALFLSLVDVLAQRHALPPEDVVDLRLLAEEACVNVVHHAFVGRAPGELTLQVSYEDGTATIVLDDDGHAFDPGAAPRPHLDGPADERDEGGLGWHLIRALSDDLQYQREGGRNRLTLRKHLSERRTT